MTKKLKKHSKIKNYLTQLGVFYLSCIVIFNIFMTFYIYVFNQPFDYYDTLPEYLVFSLWIMIPISIILFILFNLLVFIHYLKQFRYDFKFISISCSIFLLLELIFEPSFKVVYYLLGIPNNSPLSVPLVLLFRILEYLIVLFFIAGIFKFINRK